MKFTDETPKVIGPQIRGRLGRFRLKVTSVNRGRDFSGYLGSRMETGHGEPRHPIPKHLVPSGQLPSLLPWLRRQPLFSPTPVLQRLVEHELFCLCFVRQLLKMHLQVWLGYSVSLSENTEPGHLRDDGCLSSLPVRS